MKGAALMASAALIASGYIQAQTPGQVPIFDQQGTGACNSAGGNDCIDSVITQASGNIGIGTTTPAAKLDVVGGNFNLENSTATSGSILKGGALFLHNFGYLNTFLGVNAGNMTMTGGFNTASGMEALQSNTSGYQNTAGGYNVLRSNTTGFSNTATGFIALQFNTTGYGNTAFGDNALNQNTTGHQNSAAGLYALIGNTGPTADCVSCGNYNSATGAHALQSNSTGYSNTATGFEGLTSNTGPTGDCSLCGSYNTATGYQALQHNTIGYTNTASGAGALSSNTTGFRNTGIGAGADVSQTNLVNATAIGYGARVDASNKIRLGNTAVTVVEGPPYSTVSDKNAKENLTPVDAEEVLQKIRAMNVTSWNYIGQDPRQFRHYGPVAQDFFAAFGDDGVGTIGSPTTITSTDLNGVLMLAVQALGQQNAELKTRIEALER